MGISGAVLESESVQQALEGLDIDPNDHKRLPDIMDPDHSGSVSVLELINGIQRLRGHPRRSDVITVDLMIRSLQEKVDDVFERITSVHQNIQSVHKHVAGGLAPHHNFRTDEIGEG